MAVQGPLLRWVAFHRRHHQYSDGREDPHSPHHGGGGLRGLLRGLWHAHLGWLFRPDPPGLACYVRDLRRSRLVRAASALWPLWVAAGLLLPAAVGALLAGGWMATHWLLRESGVWHDRNTEEVRAAQRDADYAYRLAVDPPASKELRLFGLAGWTIERFIARRTRLHELQYAATRLRERPVIWSLLIVVATNVVVFWMLANAARRDASHSERPLFMCRVPSACR